ncbi:MAG: hypothetical protein HY287_00365 [Planctomycetes bacterium]|nr:hypothetical protein [Planctomycetota bacterium]MBI3832766.1 hypothetical protein [Planctomycetota bacterium]
MSSSKKHNLVMFDGVFATVFAACLTAGAYLVFVRHDHTSSEIRDFRETIGKSRAEILNLKADRDRLNSLVTERKSVLAQSGILPPEMPIERYFENLSRLASEHHLQVLRQNPLSPRTYPGLLEQRFSFEVSGATTDLMFLLKSIENVEAWADVSFIKISDGKSRQESGSDDRVALLTISIFSPLAIEAHVKGTP